MAEVNLFLEHFIQECADSQLLLPETLIANQRDFFHFICRNRAHGYEVFFRLGDLPDSDFCFIIKRFP